MKLTIDERLKYRLTGTIVLISLATIFLPVVFKKSTQNRVEHVSVSVKLPPRPTPPQVSSVPPNVLLHQVKAAQKTIPTGLLASAPRSQIAEIKSLLLPKPEIRPTVVPKISPVLAQAKSAVPTIKLNSSPVKFASPVAAKGITYSVQIASFANRRNADLLVKRLRSQGYVVYYQTVPFGQGELYKVLVGESAGRAEARVLQARLSNQLQLSGFLVERRLG